MPTQVHSEHSTHGWFTRERLLTLLLIAVTLLVIYVCYLITKPFLPALAWAVALAVITHPISERIERYVKKPGLAAGLCVVVVVVCIVVPFFFVAQQLYVQAADGVQNLRQGAAEGRWRSAIEQNPRLAPVMQWLETKVNVAAEVEKAVRSVAGQASSFLTSSVWAVTQALITILSLFYFYRDRPAVMRALRSLVPLSERETDQVFRRLSDTIFATVFGSLTVAAVQGTLGGLMFWFLGLPAPVLWGLVMTVVAVIPTLGAFVVWVPAAIFLALEGSIGKAMILVAWGMTAVGLIDNLLYPILVGHRLAVHPLPIFFSIVGGILLFGFAGLILGPLALAMLITLTHIWRRRTVAGQPAEEALTD